jgi:putative hydrolase of the HAD superfamily
MALTDRKVMTFDVVGTLIDFETGILDYVQGRAKAAGVSVTDRDPRGLCGGGRRISTTRPRACPSPR